MNFYARTGRDFTCTLTKAETVLGWLYLPAHIVGIPLLIALFVATKPGPAVSDVAVQGVYVGVGLVFVCLFFRKMLRREFDHLCDNLGGSFTSFAMAYCLWYTLVMLYVAALSLMGVDMETNANQSAVDDLARQSRGTMMVIAVFAGPIVEEVLFRGVVFQSIRKKHRALAYVVSITLFSLYHVWDFALLEGDPAVLLQALQYVPITLALTFGYERSGTLWVPIFMHILNNFLALTAR